MVLSASSVPSLGSGPHHQFRGVPYLNELVEDKGPSGHTSEGSRLRPSFDKENRKDTSVQHMSGFSHPEPGKPGFHGFTRSSPHAGPGGSDCSHVLASLGRVTEFPFN